MKTPIEKHWKTFPVKILSAAVAACFASLPAHANPTSPTVTNGAATFKTTGSTLTVTNTPNTIINWANFSINTNETTRFVQQSAASAVLNRVTGGDPSTILGALQSNGRVFLINPNGIVIGAGAQINTTGFIASTLNLTDDDFIHGRMRFNANVANPGAITNAGEIRTPNGGFVYLIAPNVENNGLISTPSGEAILAAGNSVELVDSTDPSLRVKVSAQSQDINLSQLMVQSSGNIFSVINRGKVSANTVTQDATGKIYFRSAGNIETTATSVVEAKGSATLNGGMFRGFADQAGVYKGVFDVSGKNGGFLETSGSWIDINDAQIIARALDPSGNGGTWLLDPNNIQITSAADSNISGNPNFVTTSDTANVSTTSIQNQLNLGVNVVISTGTAAPNTQFGDILVVNNILMTGASNAALTLNAHRNIEINPGVSIQSTGGKLAVTLNGNISGTGGNVKLDAGSQIVTNGGNITLQGAGSATDSTGVDITGASTLLNSGIGNITITGVGLNTAGYGVAITNTAQIVSSGGNISITGTAGNGAGGAAGIIVAGGAKVNNSGSGAITLNGTGGNGGIWDTGVLISNLGTSINSVNGTIYLEGTQRGAAGGGDGGVVVERQATINATGSGNIYLVGHGGISNDISLSTNTGGPYSAVNANTGSINFVADNRIYIDPTMKATTVGTATLTPFTAVTQVDAGTAVLGKLSFTASTLNQIHASTINVASSGNITVSAPIALTSAPNLYIVSGSNIITNANVSATGTLLVGAGSNVNINSGSQLSASGILLTAQNLNLNPTGSASKIISSGFLNINLSGNLNLNAGIGTGADAQILGSASGIGFSTLSPGITVAGNINFNSNGGQVATIEAGGGSIYVNNTGSIFVDGVQTTFSGNSGFKVAGSAAIVNTNLFINGASQNIGAAGNAKQNSLINFMNGELLNSTSVNNLISNIGKDNNPFGSGSDNKPAECVAL